MSAERNTEKTLGTLAGAVAVLVSRGWTDEQILAEVRRELREARQEVAS